MPKFSNNKCNSLKRIGYLPDRSLLCALKGPKLPAIQQPHETNLQTMYGTTYWCFEWWWSPQQRKKVSTWHCAYNDFWDDGRTFSSGEVQLVQQLQLVDKEIEESQGCWRWLIQLFSQQLVTDSRHLCVGFDDRGRWIRKPRLKSWFISPQKRMVIPAWIGVTGPNPSESQP